jgi:hypothetical protein
MTRPFFVLASACHSSFKFVLSKIVPLSFTYTACRLGQCGRWQSLNLLCLFGWPIVLPTFRTEAIPTSVVEAQAPML